MLSCLKIAAVGAHLATWHSSDDYNYRNFNPGVYVRTECNIQVGYYKNSVYRDTFYAAYNKEVYKGLGLFLGGATGYNSGVSPLAGVSYKLGKVNLVYTPKIKGLNDTHLIHFMLEF